MTMYIIVQDTVGKIAGGWVLVGEYGERGASFVSRITRTVFCEASLPRAARSYRARFIHFSVFQKGQEDHTLRLIGRLHVLGLFLPPLSLLARSPPLVCLPAEPT